MGVKNCKSFRKTGGIFQLNVCLRKIYKKTCTTIFIEAMFLEAKIESISKYISKRMVKILSYIHTMENYSSKRNNQLILHIKVCMNLKNKMLNKRRQTLKSISYVISFICSSRTDNSSVIAGRR